MRTHPLGNTGLEVSALCLGAMWFGTRNDKDTSYRMLNGYVEAGGSFIDTANIYAHWIAGNKGGESETLLGEWMRQRGNRSQMFIASKVGFGYPGVPVGLTAKLIEDECNKSLKRLNIDTIDLYYAHVDDRHTPLEETMEAFNRLVQAGKVRYIGASNYVAWRLEQAHGISTANGWAEFCCIQQHYTYLRLRPGTHIPPQTMVNDDLLDYCRTTGLTLLGYSVLQAGAYTRSDKSLSPKFTSPDNDRRLAALREVAVESGATVNQVILRWMMQTSPSSIPLIAASDDAQLRENLGALDAELTPEQLTRLNTAGVDDI